MLKYPQDKEVYKIKGNETLNKAKKAKNDEFYTQLSDIEDELQFYTPYLENKTILCNCDNPEWSNFWKFFYNNFHTLKLKKIIATHYVAEGKTYKLEYDGINFPVKTFLQGNGDFRSAECEQILSEADIIISNPPFSAFRYYLTQIQNYDKKFLIIGNQNAIKYNEVFPYIKSGKIWTGHNYGSMKFMVPDDSPEKEMRFWIDEENQKWRSLGNTCWFTNLGEFPEREPLNLTHEYSPNNYPVFDNYKAINCNKVSDIPYDYDESIGVPITFILKHNPQQFKIVDFLHSPIVDNTKKYSRIIIKKN